MVTEQEREAIASEEYLKLLPIGYWVSAGFWGAYGLFIVLYFGVIGAVFSTFPDGENGPPAALGWIFVGAAVVSVLLLATLVTFKVLVGFWIRKRRHFVATMVVAAITCLEVPYGTLLGVLTFIAFSRPSVRAMYSVSVEVPPPPAPSAPMEETVPSEADAQASRPTSVSS